MFGGSANAKQAPSVSTLRVQSSIYGIVLPTIRGTNRLAAKLIDWADFIAIPHTEKVGGKGFGGGDVTNYTYQAAVDLALAMTPGCVRLGKIWDGQGEYGNGQMIEQINLPSGNPGSYKPIGVSNANYSYDVGVSLITTQQVWVPAYDPSSGLPQSGGAPGVGDGYYETVNVFTPMKRVGGNPGPGQYSITGSGDALAYLFAAADAGKSAKMVYGLTVNIAYQFTFFNGARPQTAWAYMLGRYPTRALAYAGTCHIAAAAFQLGSSGTLDNLNVELIGPGVFGGGIQDAGIDQCIHLVTDDPDGGCGFPSELIGDLTQAIAYCASAGIFFSPICDKQQTAASYLQDFCDAANLAICWNEGLLKFIPYGDRPLAGNGYTYVPDLTPIYDLTDDDFIAADDEPPIKVEREDPETLSNIIEVDILDRDLSYNTHPIKDRDRALVFRFGPIPASPRKYDFICDRNVGAIVANHIRLRVTQIDALKVSFKLGAQYELLEKMDIVTVTSKELGWVKKPFRLKECDEDTEPGATEWTAEPVMWGSALATLYPKQSPGGNATQRDAAPGSILAPIVFEAPDPLVTTGEYELWLGICGASLANWGGCHLFASSDGNTYKNVAGIFGPSRMGVLMADLPAVAGLDDTSTLDVDLSESAATMLSGTADDRDCFRTLCWIEGASGQFELISYETATLVSGNRYQLTSLRRGVFGTPVIDHAVGSRFLRCDDAVTKLSFAASDVDKTAYFKATSFNKYGLAEEELSEVAEYTYGVQGAFNNSSQIVANTATVDYDPATLTSSGVTIRAYGLTGGVPTAGAQIQFKKQDGNTFVCAALQQAAAALSTTFYAMLNRGSGTPYWLTNYADVLIAVGNGHIAIGCVTTPTASGSGGSTGGGGGTSGGGGSIGCFSGNVSIKLADGSYGRFDQLPDLVHIHNETGSHMARLLVHDHDGPMIDFTGNGELVTLEHLMKDAPRWIPAIAFYRGRTTVPFKGKVYNLHVLSDDPEDHHFVLSNGDVAHNLKMSTL